MEEAEGYRSRVTAQAEGDAQRFRSVLEQYQKAPAVTRDRLYIETMQEVYGNVSKVMSDTRSGTNLLYLPLDRLLQGGAAPAPAAGAPSVGPPGSGIPSPMSAPPLLDSRSREGTRSRDRESR
jgi:membrane protease subunit HflK